MDDKERRDFQRQYALHDYTMQQQEQFFRQQARHERNSNIPMELRPYWALGEIGINVMTVPLEVLSRRQFGIRYLSTARVIMAVVFYGLAVWLGAYINGESEQVLVSGWFSSWYETRRRPDVPNLMVLFAFAWIPAAIYNLWVIKQRERHGILWHSRSTGISYLQGRLPGSDWMHYRLWEPAAWLIVGVVFLKISAPLGLYLTIGAILMMIRNNQLFVEHNTEAMDRRDAGIEVEVLAGGMRAGGKTANHGFDPVSMPEDMNASIADFEEGVSVSATMQRIRNMAAHAPRVWEDINTIVGDVTGKRSRAADADRAQDNGTEDTRARSWDTTKADAHEPTV